MSFGRPQLVVALLAVTLAATVALGGARVAAENQAERVFREAREYTVRIRTQIETPFMGDEQGSAQGAGFLIDAKRGWILTNAHVVGNSPAQVQVAFAGEDFQPAEKIYVDPFADVAVIAIPDAGSRRVAVLGGGAAEVGDAVGVFGHPMSMYFTGTRGIVSGHSDRFGPDLLQVDATVDHGNSGGPAIEMRTGRVIGLATLKGNTRTGDRVNFVTPIDQVAPMLDQLRRGVMPSPPVLSVGLMRDERESHTLVVAATHDPERWPLEPGDRIVAVQGVAGELETLTDLVTRLRGRNAPVTLRVERGGREIPVEIRPELHPLTTQVRGLSIDGALVATTTMEDSDAMPRNIRLVVHSVEPGSPAEAVGLAAADIVHTIDGRSFADLDALAAHLGQRPQGRPLAIVVTRWSDMPARWFDYHVRELPGDEVADVGAAKPQPAVAANAD